MRYFYYRIYQRLKKVESNDTPAFNALLLLTLLQILNILTLLSIVRFFVKFEIGKQQGIICGLIISFLILIVEFKNLFHKKDEICRQYENETKEKRWRGTVYLLLYIIISVTLFFVIGKPF